MRKVQKISSRVKFFNKMMKYHRRLSKLPNMTYASVNLIQTKTATVAILLLYSNKCWISVLNQNKYHLWWSKNIFVLRSIDSNFRHISAIREMMHWSVMCRLIFFPSGSGSNLIFKKCQNFSGSKLDLLKCFKIWLNQI